ncbi:membrane-spanning 4-domains subfamily A member 3-like isoform 1-T1 [Pholidichthys leucotaenia]
MLGSTSETVKVGGRYIVTHVNPDPQAAAPQAAPERNQFSRRRPEALGTVQIMIGIVVFLLGMVWIPLPGVGAFSGIFVWGAAFFITSGSLTVAAGKSSNRCLVNTALGFNVVAAVTAGFGIIIYSLDAALSHNFRYCGSFNSYKCFYHHISTYIGVSIILAIFCLLELIVSIYVAAVLCCVIPCCCAYQPAPMIILNQPVPPASVTMEAPSTYIYPTLSEGAQPPAYNQNVIG